MAVANISGKLSRQVLKIFDDPSVLKSFFTHVSFDSSQMQKIFDDLSEGMHKAIKENKVDEWLEKARKNPDASDEELKFLNAPETKEALEFASRIDSFSAEFGEAFLKGDKVDVAGIAQKYGISEDMDVYEVAQKYISIRDENIEEIAKEIAKEKGGDASKYTEQARKLWSEGAIREVDAAENVKVEIPENFKTILTDGSNRADAELEYNLWASMRGERPPLTESEFGPDVSDAMKKAYMDVVERSHDEITAEIERLIDTKGGSFDDYHADVQKIWIAKNDPNSPEYDPNFAFEGHKVEEPKVDVNSAGKIRGLEGIDERFVKTKADIEFIKAFWAEVRGEGDVDLNKFKFQRKEKVSNKEVSDAAQSYVEMILKRADKEINEEAKRLITNLGGEMKVRKEEAREIWISKVDPTRNPNAASYEAPKFDMRVENALRNLIEAGRKNENAINIARDTFIDMGPSFMRLLRSGEDADILTIQRRLIKDAQKANDESALALFNSPEFKQKLNVLSQRTNLEDDYWKALEEGTDLSKKEISKKYPALSDEIITKAIEDFKKANEEIMEKAKELAKPHTASSFAIHLDLPRTEKLDDWLMSGDKTPEDLVRWLKNGADGDAEISTWVKIDSNAARLKNGIKPRKPEDFIDTVRKKYIEENNPNIVVNKADNGGVIDNGNLPEYKDPQTPLSDLPKFKPKITKLKLKMHMETSDRTIFPTPKFVMYSAKAMLPQSKKIVDPVLKYADEAMRDTGVMKMLQGLNDDLIAAYKESGDINDVRKLIKDFAEDDEVIANLTAYRNKMQELRYHVDAKFLTNKERYGTDNTTWKDDLTEDQKSALLDFIDTQIRLAVDMSKGLEGNNAKEAIRNLERVQNGSLSIKKVEDSITGLFNANYHANISYTYLTDTYPKHLGGGRARWQFREARTRAIEAGAYYGGETNTFLGKHFLTVKDNNEFATQNKYFKRWLARDENGKIKADWDNDRTGENFFLTLMPVMRTGYGHEAIFNLQLLLKFKQKPGEGDVSITPRAEMVADAISRARKDAKEGSYILSPEFDFYADKIVKILEKAESEAQGRFDTTILTNNFGTKFFMSNRQAEWLFGRHSYNKYFATRYADFNRGSLTNIGFGLNLPLRWAGLPPQSLPGNVQKKEAVKYWIQKPLVWFTGGELKHGWDKESIGVEIPSFEDRIRTWRREIEGADGKTTKESRFKVGTRATLRLGTFGAIEDITFGRGYVDHLKEMTWRDLSTYMNWSGFKTSSFGTVLIGGNGLAGAYAAAEAGDYDDTGAWTVPLMAWNATAGFAANALTTFGKLTYDENKDEYLGLGYEPSWLVKAGALNLAHAGDIITDYTIGEAAEGVYHAIKEKNAAAFFDFGREDDGWNMSQTLNNNGVTYGSIFFDDFLGLGGESTTPQKSSNEKSGGQRFEYERPEGTPENLEEAKAQAKEYLEYARGKSRATGEDFNSLVIAVDNFVTDRHSALDALIETSKSLGEKEKVKSYIKLKTQLNENADRFRAQIESDRSIVNSNMVTILQNMQRYEEAAQNATHIIAVNQILSEQEKLVRKLDDISDNAINLREADFNAMVDKFDKAIETATPIADTVVAPSSGQSPAVVNPTNEGSGTRQQTEEERQRAELEAIKDTPLGRAKLEASEIMAEIRDNRKYADDNVRDAQKLIKALDGQIKSAIELRKEIARSGDYNREYRVQALDSLISDIRDNREKAAQHLDKLKTAAESAKTMELSAVVLIDEIANIPNVDNAANLAIVEGKLSDLRMQSNISKAASNDTEAILEDIKRIGSDNIELLKSNPDFVEKYREIEGGELIARGALKMGGGSPNSIPAMLVGNDGVSGAIGGAWDMANGFLDEALDFWNDLEQNTKSKREQDWLLIIKSLGLFGLGALAIGKFDDWFMGGKMGKGWKFLGLATIALTIMYKSGEWGDDMEAAREGKSPFAQVNNAFANSAVSGNNGASQQSSHIPVGERPFGHTKIVSSNPNPRDISNNVVDINRTSIQDMNGSIPKDGSKADLMDGSMRSLVAQGNGKHIISNHDINIESIINSDENSFDTSRIDIAANAANNQNFAARARV